MMKPIPPIRKRPASMRLRKELLLWTISVSLFLAALVGGVSLYLSNKYLKESQYQSSLLSLSILGEEIQADLEKVMTFASWITLDSQTATYLSRHEKSRKKGDALSGFVKDAKEKNDLRALSLSAWNRLNEEYRFSAVHDYLGRVLVSSPQGEDYLQLILNPSSSSVRLLPSLMEAPFFTTHLESPSFLWDGIWENPVSSAYRPYILPVVRPIKSFTSGSLLGFVYLEVSAELISHHLQGMRREEDSRLYITFQEGRSYEYQNDGFLETELPQHVYSYHLPEEGITLSLLPSQREMWERMRDFFLLILIVLLLILACGLLLSLALRNRITRPIDALLLALENIGAGDFSRNKSIEWDNELGDIGKGINALSGNVQALMEKRLLDEAQKQELKYQMLLYQVNPHFIYNTLGAIKWMATLQGSEGIAQVSTALARLLKNVSKGNEDLIPLGSELDLVRDYFTIMNYRYGGTIELIIDVEDPALLTTPICRFSLQPIVENAIFHGIEPGGKAGQIEIKVQAIKENIQIQVTDNGVGMEKEVALSILSDEKAASHDFFRHVGIANVAARTAHAFGPDYGLSIVSEIGKYTKVFLTIPRQESKNETEK